MEKYIDLTFKTNINDDEMRELLNKPGFYRIPIKNYSLFNDTPVIKEVEVVYVTPKESRMLVIIVKIDDNIYQDFYYNDNEGLFKILTFNDFSADDIDDEDLIDEVGGIDKIFTMRASWIMEEVFVPCPEEFANYEVDRNIFKEHKFFEDMFN